MHFHPTESQVHPEEKHRSRGGKSAEEEEEEEECEQGPALTLPPW